MANQPAPGPQVAPLDYGAIAGAQSAVNNPWLAISQAAAGFQDQQKARKQADEDRSYLLQQRQYQTQQQQVQTEAVEREAAQNQLKLVGNQLLADNTKASDPAHVKLVQDLYRKIGLPAPIKPDGSVDVNEFKTPFQQMDDKTQTFIMQLSPEQRKPLLDKYSGVPQDLYSTQAWISAKDQAALSRAYTARTSEEDRTRIQEKRTQLMAEVDKAREAGDYARVTYLQQQGTVAVNRAAEIAVQTSQLPTRLQNETKRVNGYLSHLEQVGVARTGQFAVMNQLRTSAKAIDQVYNEASNQYDKLNLAYTSALSNNADPDSDQMKAIHGQIEQAQADMENAKTARERANDYLFGAGPGSATAGYVTGSGGGAVTNVEVPGNKSQQPVGDATGIKDGTTANKGKYVARGGKWYAK